ncbi:MAG: hypothetical protein GFH27_549379n58 [Chloroflexi bacterium AL-W]|nr:hypothetical protein [Chloroflexi bacterium AL-N1]NOK71182.1 hypothetical protein [Chloroflexi bacterium AL-N10]NOK78648.1 hypothetical protein [Chloroflexi bacterium AL-N5]NOK85944.1 hypothetical protein [Chloroflexi bacterium AL-W]NOK92919.1 hypothetical protein [Chloroflexi bacterium AL-N15]
MNVVETLAIRPAQPSDREHVFAMVAHVWEGNDYIPRVWDDWLADSGGAMFVGELEGKPVALAKITAVDDDEDWFEGLRVDPDYRGRGLSRVMLRHCVEYSRNRGVRFLRFITSDQNLPMHRIGADLGFKLRYAPVWYAASALVGTSSAVALSVDHLPQMMVDLQHSPLLTLTDGVYTYGWTTFTMSERRVRQHLTQAHVMSLPRSDAWAIIEPSERGGWWIAHAEGTVVELTQLFTALRYNPESHADIYVRAQLPPESHMIIALREAGFETGEHNARVYEISFE